MLPEALPYHLKVRDYFRRHVSLWEYFVADRSREGQSGGVLSIPENFSEEERAAFIAHEDARVRLYTVLNGEIGVVNRILNFIAGNESSDPVALETVRLFGLYTEVFCDRCAYTVTGDIAPVIGMIQKLGMERELRMQALLFWQEQGEAAVEAIVEGVPEFGRLDLARQQELNDLTYQLLQEFLQPDWFRTEIVSDLERQYFPGGGSGNGGDGSGVSGSSRPIGEMAKVIAGMHPDIQTYFAYVLLDFAVADPSLKEMSAGRALEFAGQLGLSDVYDKISNLSGQRL